MENTSIDIKQQVQNYPAKCDHCPWTGKVSEAKMVGKKARCPECGGSLASNTVADQLVAMVKDFPNPDGWD